MSEHQEQEGAALIAAERRRQIEVEGYTSERDKLSPAGDFVEAAVAYAVCTVRSREHGYTWWPWDARWYKPKDRLSNLVRAGALIAAAIDRLNGVVPASAPAAAMETGEHAHIVCFDCGRQYGNEHGFPDLVVPHDVWKQISPTGDEGGMLCPSCICGRLYEAGIETTGKFTSGPLAWPSGSVTETAELSAEELQVMRNWSEAVLRSLHSYPQEIGRAEDILKLIRHSEALEHRLSLSQDVNRINVAAIEKATARAEKAEAALAAERREIAAMVRDWQLLDVTYLSDDDEGAFEKQRAELIARIESGVRPTAATAATPEEQAP